MSRPVDRDVDFSPHEILFMDCIVDEHGMYDGRRTALRYMLESGCEGYIGFDSDHINSSLARTNE